MKKFLPFVFVLFLAACGHKPSVLFNQPQPPNSDNLKQIPERLWGTYQSRKDSSMLTVTKDLISREVSVDVRLKNNRPDSGFELHGDTLINLSNRNRLPLIRLNDSLLYYKYSDTLFSLSGRNIIRKFKGYFFLNTPYESEWEVQKISLHKGVLTISEISSEEDIKNLNEIRENGEDTLIHHVSPTQRQFRKFVRNQGFDEGESFVKVK